MQIRRCCVCKQPIEHLHERRTTCGHPRCQRTLRSGNLKRKQQRGEEIITPRGQIEERAIRDETAVRREIIARVKFAEARGGTRNQAIRWTADKMNLPVKDIISTLSADK